jgi:flagellar motor switch protein FliM
LPLASAAAASSATGFSALEEALGSPLDLKAQEPYLLPADRLPTLQRGGRLFALSQLQPSGLRALLIIDESLFSRIGQHRSEWMKDILAAALEGAPVRIDTLTGTGDDASLPSSVLTGDGAAPKSLLILDLAVTVRGSHGWARLIFPGQLRLGSAPAPSSATLQRAWHKRQRLDGVSVELCIEAGFGFLPGKEVLALEPGDVVLLDHFGPKPVTGGPVWLRLGGGVIPGHLDGSGVTVLGSFHLRAQAMAQQPSDDNDRPTPDATPPSDALLRELPVQITCEIGRVTLSAREVLELRPGAVVPVGRPLAGPVDLTAGGRVLARGELVDVEGEIGVRVTELADT